MHDWRRSRIGSNRPGATRQDAQNGGPRYGYEHNTIPTGATASSSHRAFALSQLETELQTSTACECRSGWQCGACPCMGSRCYERVRPSRQRWWIRAAESSTHPRRLLI